MKNLLLWMIALFVLVSCETISNKTEGFKNPRHECPESGERKLSDIFCKEKK